MSTSPLAPPADAIARPATAPAPQPLRFFHRGALVTVASPPPTRSVLDWLREDAQCTGTKEGCNEGDCGACTVVIGHPVAGADDAAAQFELETVNACIRFLPSLHGKALYTVEDLKAMNGGALHPVQQALVDGHGSQCGFCTPGFVMSLWAAYERHQRAGTRPTRQALADELSGNLCRCTGYRPILDAGERMFDAPAVRLDTAPVAEALQGIGAAGACLGGTAPDAPRFFAPTDLAELAALREAHPQATLLAGGTDIGLWVTKQLRPLGDVLYVGDVAALRHIDEGEAELRIGAGASLEAAWSALARRAPELTEVGLRFASPPVRHAGTMGGNVANGSPIGDAAPVLMALDAALELRRGERRRRVALADFYTGYMKNRLEPGEFIEAIAVPHAAFGRQLRVWKISKRFDSDISAVLAALSIRLDSGRVGEVRLAFGGLAAVVKRAAQAEAALLGQAWTEASLRAAQAALAHDFQPLTDMRASAAYRLQVAQNLLRRFWLETRPDAPLAPGATRVWQVMPDGHAPAARSVS